jgi:hypothetical protein
MSIPTQHDHNLLPARACMRHIFKMDFGALQ